MDSVNPQAPPVPFSPGLGLKFYRYRALIRRHWWILMLTVGIGLAYEGYVLFTKPQVYESSSQLIIREELLSEKSRDFADTTGNFFNTAVEQLKSNVVLERAKSRLALEVPNLTGEVTITASVAPRTNIFTVNGVGKIPEYTRLFVDAVVKEYLEVRAESRKVTIGEVTGSLADQIKQLQEELNQQKARLQAYIEQNNMTFWQERGKSAALFLSGLKDQQAKLENELQRLQNLTPDELLSTPLAQPAVAKPQPGALAAASRPEASFNSELYVQFTQVTQQLIQKQAELEEWKLVWKPKHRKLQALVAQVESLQRLLNVIKNQNVSATKGRIAAIQAELKSLESSILNWDKQVLEASRKDAEYQTLQSDVARTQSQLEKLLGNSRDLGSAKNTGPDPLIVMHKATRAIPVPAGTVKHLLIGLIGGFVVGMVILILLDRSDDRLSSSTEMLEQFSEPILGQIPNVIESRQESGLPLLQSEDERYSYAESFRSLRSSLIFMPNQGELKTILITSAIPNEGKSTIASNLAITMAAAGARVLLVDADLRRGDLAPLFETDADIGLSNILRGEVNWREVVQPTKYPTLSLIARGPVTNQSGELLLKPHVITLLDEFKANYDLTIFNTAPILAADDTPTLAPNFDGTLMVVRAQFTSARLAQSSLNTLYQRQVNVLGLILNCVDIEMPDYYHYRYPKYYAA
ncbi:MAG: polysaccharide biosynthesis tyrosine autokinase [Bryobacteraceae bacterium]|nr:polysaccharide biosynthesis tyrosine autokinase [Bryobacteraceae bacterium]